MSQSQLTFEGSDFDQELDGERLTTQISIIFDFMKNQEFRTLREISLNTGAPEASASAQLRNLKKPKNGGHTINKRRRLDENGVRNGPWEYQCIPRTWPAENTPEVIKTLPTIIYSGNTAKTTRFLPHNEWVAVCNKLRREGFKRVNSRLWRK